MTDVQAVANIFEGFEFLEITVGEYNIRSDEIRRIEVPVKSCPAWRFVYDQGDGELTLFVVNSPISILGKKKIVPIDETEPDYEPSADE